MGGFFPLADAHGKIGLETRFVYIARKGNPYPSMSIYAMGYHGSNCATTRTQDNVEALNARLSLFGGPEWPVRRQRVTFDPAQTRSAFTEQRTKGRSSQWQPPCRSCPCSSHVAISNVASSGASFISIVVCGNIL